MAKGSRSNGIHKKKREQKRKEKDIERKQFRENKELLQRKWGKRKGKTNKAIYIACEGTTEELYFSDFEQKQSISIKAKSHGCSNEKLVEDAIEKINEGYDIIWAVFDYDKDKNVKNQQNQIDKAYSEAKKNNIKIAFSNDAFELWYLLHFKPVTPSWSRDILLSELKKFIPKYHKTLVGMYQRLKYKQVTAIKNAKILFPASIARSMQKNPSTSVHLLVIELNSFE